MGAACMLAHLCKPTYANLETRTALQAIDSRLALVDVERFKHSPCGSLVPFRGMDGRTGLPFDHFAYVADALTGEPVLAPATWHNVTAAHRALAKLDQASRQVPLPELLRAPTLRREAQSTSALEGTFAPLEQVLAAESLPDEPQTSELREVLNYVEAAGGAFAWVTTHPRITVGLLENVHQILVRGTESDTEDAGRVRRSPVAIGSPTGTVEDARFVPMPPGPGLNAAVQQFVDWIGEEGDRDPIVAAAMAHYQFETLHPFNDGNGRIGRLLIVLQFMLSDLIAEPLLSVSPWFEARRHEYQDHLADVSASGAWDSWIQFFTRGVEESAIDTARRVDRLLAIQQQYIAALQDAGARGVIRDIAELLIGSPWITVPRLASVLGKTHPAINTAVMRLVELGILTGPFGSYNRQFVALDVWETLSAPMGRVRDPGDPIRRERPDPDEAEGSAVGE